MEFVKSKIITFYGDFLILVISLNILLYHKLFYDITHSILWHHKIFRDIKKTEFVISQNNDFIVKRHPKVLIWNQVISSIPERANYFLYEQFLIAWKIYFITLSALPWM